MKAIIYLLIILTFQTITVAQDTEDSGSDTNTYKTEEIFVSSDFDVLEIKQLFLDSLNAVRKRNKFPELKYNYELEGLVKLRTKTIIDHVDHIEDKLYYSNYIKFNQYKNIRDYKYYFNNNLFLDPAPMIIHEGNLSVPSYYKVKEVILHTIQSMKDNKKSWKEFYDLKYTHVAFDFRKGVRRTVVSVIFSKRRFNHVPNK